MAVPGRNPPEGRVHHGDHGSRYASLLPSKTMRENGIRPSMGSISSPWGNAGRQWGQSPEIEIIPPCTVLMRKRRFNPTVHR